MNPNISWLKFLADLASTRIQITYIIVGIVVAFAVKGLLLAKSIPDITALVASFWPIVLMVLGVYFGGKVVEGRPNGTTP